MTQKTEIRTNPLARPCNGCPGKIQIGEQMIVINEKEFYHQLCLKLEHKK